MYKRQVAGAVEQTWTEAAKQIKSVVEKVVFPALDMILAIAFFVKLGGAYFDYRQRGQFEWTGPALSLIHIWQDPDALRHSVADRQYRKHGWIRRG